LNDGVRLGASVQWVTGKDLPVVEDALREGLATGITAEVGGEPERLVDGQVGFHDEHRCTRHLHFLEYVTTPTVQHTVDATNGNLGTLKQNEHEQLFPRTGETKRVQNKPIPDVSQFPVSE